MPTSERPKFALRWGSAPISLEVTFHWSEDRYLHRIEAVSKTSEGTQRRPLLTSVEGTSTIQWPASPPLQGCQLLDQSSILATGMAAGSHWSLALTEDSAGLVWDVACRLKQLPARLGSAYRALVPLEQQGSEARLMLDHELGNNGTCVLHVESPPESPGQLIVRPGRLEIQPTADCGPPATIRWRYRLALTAPGSA